MKFKAACSARRFLPLVTLLAAVLLTVLLTGDALAWTGAITIPNSTNAVAADTAVDPTTGKLHVAWFSSDGTTTSYNYSACDSNANNCSSAVTIGSTPNAGINPEFGNNDTMRPSISVASDGTVYYAFPPGGTGTSTAIWKKKAPGSSSWGAPTTLGTGWGVRIAVDSAGNLHALWGSGGFITYKKFDNTGTLLKTIGDIGSGEAGLVAIIPDNSNNLHIVYETIAHDIKYRQVNASGNIGPTIVLSSSGAYEQEPSVALDAGGRLHIAFQSNASGSPKIVHMSCSLPISSAGSSCSAQNVVSGGNIANWGSVAAVGSSYFVSYNTVTSGSCGGNTRVAYVFSSVTNNSTAVDNQCMEWFTTLRGSSDGELHLLYRKVSGGPATLIYRHQPSGAGNNPPAAPSNLVATPSAPGVNPIAVGLTWTDNSNNETGFRIERATKTCASAVNGDFAPVNTVGQNVQAFNDTTVAATTTYCYRVFAHNAGGDSTASNTDEATTPVAVTGTPVDLTKGSLLKEVLPTIVKSGGNIIVAYEQDTSTTSKKAYSLLSTNGTTFGAPVLLSNQPVSVAPFLYLAAGSDAHAVYMGKSGAGQFDVYDTVLNAGAWGSQTNVSATPSQNSQDGEGVQAGNKIWIAWRESTGTLTNNVFVEQLGGSTQTQLSSSGSAGPHPVITGGSDGKAFVAWTDKGGGGTGCCIKVSEFDGSKWVALANIVNSTTANLPSIAYAGGKLYAVWLDGVNVNSRIWDGTNWGAVTLVYKGTAPKSPRVAVGATGNVYVVWADSGKVYMSKNGTKRVVSGTVTGAKDPAIYVDGDIPYLAFQNGDIWYVANP